MFRSRFNPETNDSSVTPWNYRLFEDELQVNLHLS